VHEGPRRRAPLCASVSPPRRRHGIHPRSLADFAKATSPKRRTEFPRSPSPRSAETTERPLTTLCVRSLRLRSGQAGYTPITRPLDLPAGGPIRTTRLGVAPEGRRRTQPKNDRRAAPWGRHPARATARGSLTTENTETTENGIPGIPDAPRHGYGTVTAEMRRTRRTALRGGVFGPPRRRHGILTRSRGATETAGWVSGSQVVPGSAHNRNVSYDNNFVGPSVPPAHAPVSGPGVPSRGFTPAFPSPLRVQRSSPPTSVYSLVRVSPMGRG
jgi:hypothetical protein